MINPKIYLKAAVEASEYMSPACGAIYMVLRKYLKKETVSFTENKEYELFRIFFMPKDQTKNGYWFGNIFDSDNQNDRITALLLMHEIAKDLNNYRREK